jgi:signal transduction histidine kinase
VETVVAPAPPIKALLAHAAEVMGTPRILVIWDTPQERERHFALWDQGRLEYSSEVAGEPIEDLVAPCLSGSVFMTRSATSRMATTPSGMKFCRAPVVGPRLQNKFNMGKVVSAPFAREAAGCVGRVFALGCTRSINSQLSLIEIVANRIGLELEYHFLHLQTELLVAARERSKLAHDVHDGLLQSLTAATLQLNLSSKKCNGKTRQDLISIQRLLTSEQKRLREFVDGGGQAIESGNVALATWCERVLTDLGEYWHCETRLDVVPADAVIPPAMAGHLSLILAEALANSAKHGRASRVLVTLERTAEALFMSINDNGSGFRGLTGSYTSEDLASGRVGPRFLCDRIRDLRGELTLSTSLKGSSLRLTLPMAGE